MRRQTLVACLLDLDKRLAEPAGTAAAIARYLEELAAKTPSTEPHSPMIILLSAAATKLSGSIGDVAAYASMVAESAGRKA